MTQNRSEKIIVHVNADGEDLIRGYLQHRRDDVKTILSMLEKGDYETIRILGHNMKGSGGGYGFDAITDIGASIEQSAKDKNPREIRKKIDELSAYLERLEVVYE